MSLRPTTGYDGAARSVAANSGYQVESLVPELVLIGSNGGPTAYGIDRHRGGLAFVSIPFHPMQRGEVRVLGRSFAAFLASLGVGEGW
ncbi:hypothetical protein [Chelatococcus reniformis]|uniref:Knr4/Smi1-like domain-containing protein n=1 Tax=Chelatococcus reniformis TaxID=1494448 RepID=A0A916U409_9HYPH|nr:hypothetical protein [Chelatococcus reniformis]GGC59449.1 hypothetical protein GCM10010994_17750 [Chelatococcus reniformis]